MGRYCHQPEPPRCDREHVDPKADTIQPHEGVDVFELDDSWRMTRRPATEADMRHCASCTCPVRHEEGDPL